MLRTKVTHGLDMVIALVISGIAFLLPLTVAAVDWLLLAGVVAWVGRMLVTRTWELTRLPFDWLLALLVGVGLLAVLVSPDRGFSWYNYTYVMGRCLTLYYFICHNVHSLRQVMGLLKVMAAAAVVVAGYGLYQYLFGLDVSTLEWVDPERFPELKVRIFSTLQNPNLLAGFLVAAIAVALGIGSSLRIPAQRLALGSLVVLFLICLALTYSRGAWLSLAVVVGLYGVVYDRRYFWLLLFGPAVMLCFHEVLGRFTSIFQVADTSSTLRLALWHSTLAMIRDYPLFGIGWGVYWQVYPRYDYFIANEDIIIYHAHNMYLHIAAETGLVGLAVFLAVLAVHLWLALRLVRDQAVGTVVRGIAIGLAAAIIGFCVSGLTDYVLFSLQLALLAWLLLAMLVALWRVAGSTAHIVDNSKLKGVNIE